MEEKNKRIILNNKSYLTYDEMLNYKRELGKITIKNIDLILMPQMIYLSSFKNSKLKIGAQNFYSYNGGSYTGETNLEALKSINVNTVLLGHSERKELLNETYEMIRNKLFKSLNSKFDTILCVGELKKKDNALGYIKKELKYYMHNLEEDNIDYLTLAYEPSWAIGGFESLETEKISQVVNGIKKYMLKKYKKDIKVLYGGSVDNSNIKEILAVTDGVILGRLSTDINKVKELIKKID